MAPPEPLLDVRDLRVSFGPGRDAVRGVSLTADRGETVAVVGESGCGKSLTALSLIGLLPPGAAASGTATLGGRPLIGVPEREMRAVRGRDVAMILQDAMTALDPLMPVGGQIAEVLAVHGGIPRRERNERAVELLRGAGVPDPAVRARQYPHELSGGLRQRMMVAIALAGEPDLVIADEPTTALDVTVQAQVLRLLRERTRVRDIVAEPLRVHGADGDHGSAVTELLDLVGLPGEMAARFPHELSGGQRQRVSIARAIALRPGFVVCDEPVSALDVPVQAQVVNVQRELGMAYLFISHDLAVVRYLADETAVMYLGRIVERGPSAELFRDPRHPYTQLLLASAPRPRVGARREAAPRAGEPPSPLDRPSGCVFSARCPLATDRCREEVPVLRELPDGRGAACHYAETADVAAGVRA
ncbi:MAG: ATP-binding cassette domain-containing protein [Streptosporangiales bacterium]|nr:ATP-binding cassette domain-containing protein [Streptosporangiales bacterium]